MFRHLVVAVDGSDGSRRAMDAARELVRRLDARLTVLMVLEPPTVLPVGPMDGFVVPEPPATPKQLESALGLLSEWTADLPPERVQKRVEVAAVADTICREARVLEADLIVVGARGLGRVERWLLGSVSDRVLHHAGRSVLVVR